MGLTRGWTRGCIDFDYAVSLTKYITIIDFAIIICRHNSGGHCDSGQIGLSAGLQIHSLN